MPSFARITKQPCKHSAEFANASAVVGRVIADSAVARCQRHAAGMACGVQDAAAGDRETGDGHMLGEIVKHAVSVAVECQHSSTGTIDCDVVG